MTAPSTTTMTMAPVIPYQKRSTSDSKRTLSRPIKRWYPPGNITCEATTRMVDPPPRPMTSPYVPDPSGTSAGHLAKLPASRRFEGSANTIILSPGKLLTCDSIAVASPFAPSRWNMSTSPCVSSPWTYSLKVERFTRQAYQRGIANKASVSTLSAM